MMSLKAAIGIPQLAIGKMNFWISLRLVCDSDESVQNFLSFEFHLTMTCLQDPRNADLVSGFRLVNGCVFRKFKVKKKFKIFLRIWKFEIPSKLYRKSERL